LGPPLSKPALALSVLHHIGPFFSCDPDTTPLGRFPEYPTDRAGFRMLQRRQPGLVTLIARDVGLSPRPPYRRHAVEAIWSRYNRMSALESTFVPDGNGYRFSYLPAGAQPGGENTPATGYAGHVRSDGVITEQSPTPVPNFVGCPICLLRNARIATPDGRMPIAALVAGDPVWTADADGHRIVGRVLAQRSLDVGPHHAVVHVTLADGRVLVASPGHPLVDGRVVADLHRGDRYDGSRVAGVRVRYVCGRTYDILPSGPTGQYWADGVLVGSTLAQTR
jgi:hypothetical protein